MTEGKRSHEGECGLSRRRLLVSSGLAVVGAFAAAAPRTVVAATPEIDSSFKDFTLPKFQCDDSLAKIQQRGDLRLCTSNDWPYSYLDSKTNEWVGIDAEIIRFVMKMLKIPKVTVSTVPFDGMIPGLLDGRFDIVGDSIHYTKARAKVVDFCYPTYFYSEWLAVKKGSAIKARRLADLKGKSVGTLLGDNYGEWVRATPGLTYKGYKDWLAMAQDIQNGRLDAAIHDQPIISASLKDHPDWRIEMVSAYEPYQLKNPAGYSRFAFRQADLQLRVGFDAAIQWMEDSEEMHKILAKWGLGGYNN